MKQNKKVVMVLILVIIATAIMIIVFLGKDSARGSVLETLVTDNTAGDPIKPVDGSYCFKNAENQDITEVSLIIAGNQVTGIMNWIPFEKDSGRGTLSGTVADNGEMNLMYDYTIEGAYQTEEKIMKIENGMLYIKHGELEDPKYNGHLVYKDVSTAEYTEMIQPCVAAPALRGEQLTYDLLVALYEQYAQKSGQACSVALSEDPVFAYPSGVFGVNLYTILPCEQYAYNTLDFVVVRVGAEWSVVGFENYNQKDRENRALVYGLPSVSFHALKDELEFFEKFRGVGDCGMSGVYVFDSETKQGSLVEYRRKDECDGSGSQWPIVYEKPHN